MAVLGVDACRDGWVGIRLRDQQPPEAFCAGSVEALVERAGPVSVVGVDIPIGLPAAGLRVADALARKAVGPRASSVFSTPPRRVLEARTHAEAAALCRELCDQGVSQQAYALRRKVLEVDEWVARVDGVDGVDITVVEVHPEVSFATLAGRFLPEPKSTWSGFTLRRQLLADAGIVLEGDLGLAGRRAAPDDVLDAAIVAWSAGRVAAGAHRCLPDPPEVLDGGSRAAIWA